MLWHWSNKLYGLQRVECLNPTGVDHEVIVDPKSDMKDPLTY